MSTVATKRRARADHERLDRMRRALAYSDEEMLTREDLSWAIARLAEMETMEAELAKWRSRFSRPDIAVQAFKRLRELVDEIGAK